MQIGLFEWNIWQKSSLRRRVPTGYRVALHWCTFLLFVALAVSFQLAAQSASSMPIYLNKTQPIEARVDDLMQRMTLKEKVGQLNLPCDYVDALGKTIPEKMEAARKFSAGTYTNEIGPGAGFFTLADTIKLNNLPQQVKCFNELQKNCNHANAVEDSSASG
jgi:hypothetical protein